MTWVKNTLFVTRVNWIGYVRRLSLESGILVGLALGLDHVAVGVVGVLCQRAKIKNPSSS